MSVFQPINVAFGQDQKRQLLQTLMNQYQANASRAAALSGAGASGAIPATASPAATARPSGGMSLLTGMLPNLASALVARLGPGGVGIPIPGRETSPAAGMSISLPSVANPHAGGSPAAPNIGPSNPIPVVPLSGPASGTPASPSPNPTPNGVGPNGLIPLGNGIMFNPATNTYSSAANPKVQFS